jgi:hypothetical protein
MGRIALLLGILGAPAVLLVLGHHLRRRTTKNKRLFWGGVIGHTVGLLTTLVAMMAPPVAWSEGDQVRSLLVHWSMIGGFAAGMAIAAIVRRGRAPQ